jgi:hypothetical protein
MKTLFKSAIVILAAALPAAFAAEMFGVSMPAAFNTAHAFSAFVAALTILTLWNDYAPAKPLVACTASAKTARATKASRLPLAA